MRIASLLLQAVTILAAGMLVGNEFCVGAFVNPRMRALDDRTRITAALACLVVACLLA